MRVALAPTPDGFRIETEGQSTLGPFDGLIDLTMPAGGPTRIGIERLDIWRTTVTGDLILGDGAVVIILDIHSLIRAAQAQQAALPQAAPALPADAETIKAYVRAFAEG